MFKLIIKIVGILICLNSVENIGELNGGRKFCGNFIFKCN